MSQCPCGGPELASCCGPLLANREQAKTPEQLMRSRYTAYAVGDLDHVFRTWHPRTRPDDLQPEPGLTWLGLQILDVGDVEVEFEATFHSAAGTDSMRERSVFEQRAGRWVYVGPSAPHKAGP